MKTKYEVGAILQGTRLKRSCVLFRFCKVHSRHSRHSRHSTETTTDNATQDAEMTRKQLKRGNISKQYNRRENSREMLSKVSYKSDTMHNQLHTIESNKSDSLEVTSVH